MRERLQHVKDFLWFLVAVGVVAVGFRLYYGLGATTNLSDAVPWGLWKILNMVAGVALATGGFTVGFLVYVLHMERLRPLVRPAILIAFLGYSSSVAALFFDIGLPFRIWHPVCMWNFSSFLFEVGVCVATYLTVTMVELTPVVLERFPRWARFTHFLHRISPGMVILGITLSCLHHSSLGSLFLVTPVRLHTLWYSPWLPLLFITSAMGGGMMMVVLVRLFYARWYEAKEASRDDSGAVPAVVCIRSAKSGAHRSHEMLSMLGTLATAAAGILGLYLILKLADLWYRGAWRALFAGTWESWLFILELLLSAVLPVFLVSLPAVRRSTSGLATAAGLACAGLILNRLDVGIFGYFRDAGEVYLPSATEWALSLGVLAAAVLVFLKAVEELPVFDNNWRGRIQSRRTFLPSFDSFSGVWSSALGHQMNRITLVAAVAIPLAWAALYPPFASAGGSISVRPPTAVDLERKVLEIDGNGGNMAVRFPHAEHQQRLGGEQSCEKCHHLSLPRDHATPCSRCHRAMEADTEIFDHEGHFTMVAEREGLGGLHPGNRSCGRCHPRGKAEGRTGATPCLDCHREDMRPADRHNSDPAMLRPATGYRVAVHDTCIPCHRAEASRVHRPELGECRHCHPGSGASISQQIPAAT